MFTLRQHKRDVGTLRKSKRNSGTYRKSDQATDKEPAISMLRSFELDYKQACQSGNPQLLEAHFRSLSNEHLKQLCNSANITETSRERRIQALAVALLERKTAVRKALEVLTLMIRFKGVMVLFAMAFIYGSGSHFLLAHGHGGQVSLPLVLLCIFSLVWAGDSMVTFIKSCKNFGTTKSKRRILRQMRQLNGVKK